MCLNPHAAFLPPWCISGPMTAWETRSFMVSGTHGRKYPSRCNPTIGVGWGGVNCWITPRPHTQVFGGARHYVRTGMYFI